jgi:uncharacterized Zn finger protein (UPF0148 family)
VHIVRSGTASTLCQHCKRPTDLHLCTDCQTQLVNMLDEIPWLLEQLDARIQRLDRVSAGTVGRSRRPDELNVMDFAAAEEARKVRKTLLHWVNVVAERHTGRRPPALDTAATPDLARWLSTNVKAIARLDLANKGRHPLYDDIANLVGQDQRGGQLVQAINPVEKHIVGPCPTITGRKRDGAPRQCGQVLFADTYDKTVTCPICKQDINVEDNRKKAAADRDLHTKDSLLEVLTNIDEPVTADKLELWITARRLRPRGYRHDGAIVEFRINDHDEPVYSVERARKLRRRDNNLRQRRRISHA